MRSLSRTPATDVAGDERVHRRVLAVGAAVGVFGISYGVLAVAAGLPAWLTILSSLVVLAGGAQFAFIAVIAAGGAPLAGVASGLLLNLRFIPFGVALAAHLPAAPLGRRLLDGYLLVDESVAVGLSGPPAGTPYRFRLTGWAVLVTWVLGTAVGAYGGRLVDPASFGLDAAFPAGFLALLAPWLRTGAGRIAALVGTALALALTPVAPPGVPIVAAGLGAFVAMAITADAQAAPPARDDAEDGPTAGVTDGRGTGDGEVER